MVSMIRLKGRVIQAQFDGNKFYVWYSQLYDFQDYDKETMDLFLRWLMNEPIGDTVIVRTGEEEGSGSISQSKREARNVSQYTSVAAWAYCPLP